MSPVKIINQVLEAKSDDLIIDASGGFTRFRMRSGDHLYSTVFVDSLSVDRLCIVNEEICNGDHIAIESMNHPDALFVSVSKNKSHPECREGEMLLTNVPPEETCLYIPHFMVLRAGLVAYDHKGASMPGLVPIFILKEEYDQIFIPKEVYEQMCEG